VGQSSGRCVPTAKKDTHRPGLAPALGLRAGNDGFVILSQTMARRPAMSFSSWLRRLRASSRIARHGSRPRFRPGVEGLEDRSVPAVLNVTTTLDVIDPNDGVLSLREAVIQANASNEAVIVNVPAGSYTLSIAGSYEIAGLAGDLNLTGHVTINGAGAGATIVDANGIDRVFDVVPGANVTLSGMTIQGGTAELGGGIANDGDLVVRDCVVSGNGAYPCQYGGGIYSAGTLTVADTTIAGNGNSVTTGGGICNAGALTVANCIISDNTALEGGGIWTGMGTFPTVTVTNSTFSGNSGGAIAIDHGTVDVVHSTFSGNSSGIINGGGVYALRVHASTFCNNSGLDLVGIPPISAGGNTFC
jgi:hypothetical protein